LIIRQLIGCKMSLRRGTIHQTTLERVVFGEPANDAIVKEVTTRDAGKVFLLVGRTLNRETDAISPIVRDLEGRVVEVFDEVSAHTPQEQIIAATQMAREAEADLIVTVGGGSITDAGKMISLCLANDVERVEDLQLIRTITTKTGSTRLPTLLPPTIRQVAVPTTLSAGEFTNFAGATNLESKEKHRFDHPALAPAVVILDPDLTKHSPEWLWLSTGIRAVDHACESLMSAFGTPYSDAMALNGLGLLVSGLKRSKDDANDLAARLDCQMGAWLAMMAPLSGIPMGASHAIGHVLGGTCDVPHGYTSCVMLPTVMRFNASETAYKQTTISQHLGEPDQTAAELIGHLIAGLGMPTKLSDVGIGPERFEEIAEKSMHEAWLHTNPVKISGTAEIKQLLEAVR
jgi:maleylacetate reductase